MSVHAVYHYPNGSTLPGDASVGDDLTVADQLLLTETAGNHVATPTAAFGDGDTGLYESADDTLNLVSEGVAVAQINTGDQFIILETPGSHAAAPSLAFGDGDTGFYESSDDVLNIVTAGTDKLQVGGSFVNFRSVIGVLYQNVISPSALTGDVTDYAPTGVGTAVAFRIDPGAAGRVINSLSSPTSGRWAFLLNISSTQTLTLLHDDGATGTAANRFLCPNNVSVVIPPNGVREIWYDTASSRWRVFGAVA